MKTNTEISFSFWLTLFYSIPLLALTHRRTDRETITLASRGLEEPFFQLCCCVSFLFWREIGSFFVAAGNFYYDRKKKHVCLSCCDRYICISSTWIKPNTNPSVQLQYIRYIKGRYIQYTWYKSCYINLYVKQF